VLGSQRKSIEPPPAANNNHALDVSGAEPGRAEPLPAGWPKRDRQTL
jgi:hypothetical protein